MLRKRPLLVWWEVNLFRNILGKDQEWCEMYFDLRRENSPCIVFIDEIDAIATKRFDAQTGADREVQRILLAVESNGCKYGH
jgi:ATP-dependent 26S proteasome regulatory subunit